MGWNLHDSKIPDLAKAFAKPVSYKTSNQKIKHLTERTGLKMKLNFLIWLTLVKRKKYPQPLAL